MDSNNTEKYGYLLPAYISILIVGVTPIAFQIYTSFNRFTLGLPWNTHSLVGLDNYLNLFTSSQFIHSIKITVLFTLLVTSLSLVAGITLATIVNREFRGKPIVITSILIPQIISPSILGLLWKLMYNTNYGVINHFTGFLGFEFNWLGPELAFTSVVITSTWFASSFMALISLAGLESIPPQIYEVAKIDGANSIQTFFRITLPMLKPILGIAVLLQQVAAFHIFGIIYTMTGGGPGNRTRVLALHVYKVGLDTGWVGLGAASATVLALLALGLSVFFMHYMGEKL